MLGIVAQTGAYCQRVSQVLSLHMYAYGAEYRTNRSPGGEISLPHSASSETENPIRLTLRYCIVKVIGLLAHVVATRSIYK